MTSVAVDLTVFVSYASEQEELAGDVAARLSAVQGVRAIIDKVEVAGGDVVAARLRELLLQSDELVMLCSKEALASPWVMLEVGAAYGLGLRVVPILIDMGINDLPQTLSHQSVIRRDQLDAYLEQVARRVDGLRWPARGKDPLRAAVPFAVGERVVAAGPAGDGDAREDIGWRRGMVRFVGATARITEVAKGDAAVRLNVDGGEYWWAVEWLTPVR
jgi:hypothetical protein